AVLRSIWNSASSGTDRPGSSTMRDSRLRSRSPYSPQRALPIAMALALASCSSGSKRAPTESGLGAGSGVVTGIGANTSSDANTNTGAAMNAGAPVSAGVATGIGEGTVSGVVNGTGTGDTGTGAAPGGTSA